MMNPSAPSAKRPRTRSSSGSIRSAVSYERSESRSSSEKSRHRKTVVREHANTPILSGGIIVKFISAFDSVKVDETYNDQLANFARLVPSSDEDRFPSFARRFMKPEISKTKKMEDFMVDALFKAFLSLKLSSECAMTKRSHKDVWADITVKTSWHYLLIVEVKHRLSHGDAYTQLVDYYRKACDSHHRDRKRKDEHEDEHRDGLNPCLLLHITDSFGKLYGAINFNGKDMAAISLLKSVELGETPDPLYALLTTIKVVLGQLQDLVLVKSVVKAIGLDCFSMEVPLLKTSGDGQKRSGDLKLCGRLSHANDKLVFHAKLDSDVQVVAKLCSSYGQLVHQHMFSRGLAPDLLVCHETDFTKSKREKRIVVVMKYLDHLTLQDALSDSSKFRLTHQEKQAFHVQLSEIGRQLQEGSSDGRAFVHGDLREPNVLIDRESCKLYLIDFDWSGKEGEVRYPLHVNMDRFYHDNAVGFNPIQQSDDTHQLRYLQELLDNL